MPTHAAGGKAHMGGLLVRLLFRLKKSANLTGMKLLRMASFPTHRYAM